MPAKAIVVIGAGQGTEILLRGLKRYTDRLTALVSTFDAGRHGATDDLYFGAEDLVGASLLALGGRCARVGDHGAIVRLPGVKQRCPGPEHLPASLS